MKKLFYSFFTVMTVVFASVLLSGCEKEDEDGGTTDPDTETVQVNMKQAAIAGSVRDTDGRALAGVTVTTGTATTTTDANGQFTLTEVGTVGNRAVLRFEKSGYFGLTRSGVQAGEMTVEAVLKAKGNSDISLRETFSATAAKTLEVAGMKVDIPASAIVKADGTAYTGQVNADMLYLDPNNEELAGMMPGGDLAGVREDDSEAQLISYGMTEVTLTDTSGNPLQLKAGAESELTFPIPAGMEDNPPATIPLWYFDEDRGIWVEEGTASLQGNVYVGAVEHFSWHNLDYPESRITIRGKVTDCEGKPVGYVKISVEETGSTANHTATVTTGTGEYTAYVPTNTPITITVKSKDYGNYSPEVSYHLAARSAAGTVTQDISLPCREVSTEPVIPDGQIHISEASVKYLVSGEDWIFTFDNYGKRIRFDLYESETIFVSDSISGKALWYNDGEWTEYPLTEYLGQYIGSLCSIYYNYFTGSQTWYFSASGTVQSSETIAGVGCTVFTWNYSYEGVSWYYKWGFWNGITMLLEYDGEVSIVATDITSDVPDAAFTQKAEVDWF